MSKTNQSQIPKTTQLHKSNQPSSSNLTTKSERFKRTIKTMLSQFVNDQKQIDWDTIFDKLTFAYNTLVHAMTKFSPFELTFGRITKFLIDLVYDQTNSEEFSAKIDVDLIVSEL